MAAVTQGTKFPTVLITEMYNKVKGKSSIAKMIPAKPIAFNGNTQFVFSLDNEIAIVGEGAAKPAAGMTIGTVVIRPIKIVYQARVTNEFMYASEEAKLEYLRSFMDGCAAKVASGMDIMIMHGLDPKTGEAATNSIGNNYLDYVIENYNTGSNVVVYGHDSTVADVNIDEALAKVEDPNGVILGKTIRSAIAALNINGARKYPEFAWGATPPTLGGMTLDTNKTVEHASSDARAYVGDWNALRWGFAKDMSFEVIEYGNPDGGTYDLKQANEVLLRTEAFIGWGILDPAAFAEVAASGE